MNVQVLIIDLSMYVIYHCELCNDYKVCMQLWDGFNFSRSVWKAGEDQEIVLSHPVDSKTDHKCTVTLLGKVGREYKYRFTKEKRNINKKKGNKNESKATKNRREISL